MSMALVCISAVTLSGQDQIALSCNLYKPGPRRTQVYPLTSTPSASSTSQLLGLRRYSHFWGSAWFSVEFLKALLQGQFLVYCGRSKASPVRTSVPSLHSRSSSEVAEVSEPGPATPQPGFKSHISGESALSISPSLLLTDYHVTRLGLQAPTEIWSYLSQGSGCFLLVWYIKEITC